MSLTKVTYSMIDGAAVSILDYGAVGDGVTDDYQAITDALAEAASRVASGAGGYAQVVQFSAGTYLVSDTIEVPSGVILMGPGRIKPSVGVTPVISLGVAATGTLRSGLSYMTIEVPNNGVGVQCFTHWTTVFNNYFLPQGSPASSATCILLNSTGPGGNGSWVTDIVDNTMDFNQASTATNCKGIHLYGNANCINVCRNNIAGFGGIGIKIEGYQPANNPYPQLVNIVGNNIESMYGTGPNYGIWTGQCYNINIWGNYFEAIAGTNSRNVYAGADAGQTRMINIENNFMLDVGGTGFRCIALDRVTAPNIGNNYFDGSDYVSITSNTVATEAETLVAPKTKWPLLNIQSTGFESLTTSYVTATNALQYNGFSGTSNVYQFVVNFEASTADTYSFRIINQFGSALIAETVKVAGSSGQFSTSILFAGEFGNPLLQYKSAAGGQVKLWTAEINLV